MLTVLLATRMSGTRLFALCALSQLNLDHTVVWLYRCLFPAVNGSQGIKAILHDVLSLLFSDSLTLIHWLRLNLLSGPGWGWSVEFQGAKVHWPFVV